MKLWPFQKEITTSLSEEAEVLMIRYFLTPRIFGLRLCVHKFLKSDSDRAYHDHPWNYISMILKGSYKEHYPHLITDGKIDCYREFGPGSIIKRSKYWQHWVELPAEPCWTLILFYGKRRRWGFWSDAKFIPHEEYVETDY